MTLRNPTFSSAIYSDAEMHLIQIAPALLHHNSWFEPSLSDLQVGDDVEVWSVDGTTYRGFLEANEQEVQEFRKLLSTKIVQRIYALPNSTMLHELTDSELDALLIFRGLNT